MFRLPIEIQRIIYSYDSTYRYKYSMVLKSLDIARYNSWMYNSYFYFFEHYTNYNMIPSKIKGSYIVSG